MYTFKPLNIYVLFIEIDDVVGPVLFLLNDKMSAQVQGEKIVVDGGYS